MSFVKTEFHIPVFRGRNDGSISGSQKTIKIVVIRAAKVHYELYSVLNVLNMLTHPVLSVFL